MKAHLRNTRISPKKANIVAGLIRQKPVEDALNILKFTPKKASQSLYKTLLSAVSNAEHNFQQKAENLKVDQVVVNKGPVMKRFLPSTRGRALPIHKPTAHISIYLSTITQ
jgi:large subunit ribosomal protein L22